MTSDDHDPDDFERFLVRHRTRLEHLARTIAVQSGADHHALFSGTVAVLYRRWSDIATPREVTAFAFARRVMANLQRDLVGRSHARSEILTDDVRAILDRRMPAHQWDDDPEFEILRKEQRLRVYRALERLPEPERSIMILRVQGLTFPEIAERLGCTLDDVRAGVARARRALRPQLEDGDDDGR